MNDPASARLTVINYEAIPNVTPEQAQLAARRVAERANDTGDARALLEMLFAEPKVKPPRGFRDRQPRDESTLKPCGTEAAYQRHKARGEDACEPCLAAANEARAASQRATRAAALAKKEAA